MTATSTRATLACSKSSTMVIHSRPHPRCQARYDLATLCLLLDNLQAALCRRFRFGDGSLPLHYKVM